MPRALSRSQALPKPWLPAQTDSVDFVIRPYRPADFDRLWQIDQRCFPAGIAYTQMELTGFILRRNAITVVAEFPADITPAHAIAGYAIAQPFRRMGRIVTLDIAPEARRCGLGSRLIGECEDRIRQRGCIEVYLETAVDNEPAIKLYRKLGYRIVRTLPAYYHAHSLDAYLMAKALSQAC
jgi:ribosomal-protein-alanine N-acetyltransferase